MCYSIHSSLKINKEKLKFFTKNGVTILQNILCDGRYSFESG